MTLDIYTLFVCELFVLGFLSIIMVFAWIGAQYHPVLGFTTLTLILAFFSVLLSSLRSSGLQFMPIAVGNVTMLLAYGCLLNAFRIFFAKPLGYGWCMGAALWAMLCVIPAFYYHQPVRVWVMCLLCILYTGAIIQLLHRGRVALRATFWPAQVLLCIHLLFHVARALLDNAVPVATPGAIGGSNFSVYVILESIFFVIGLSFTLLAIVNERAQIAHKTASLHDPLTLVWNRRALFEQAERLLLRHARRTPPFIYTAVLFDLDHFKSINDRYGHQQGDRVLIDFCAVVKRFIPPGGHFARLGGEEFAAILPGDGEDAQRVCERIREATQRSEPDNIVYTVSIGLATAQATEQRFTVLLAWADEALYRAKASGRNRTERHAKDVGATETTVLI